MKTLLEVLRLSTDFLKHRRSAEELLAHVLKVKRIDLYLQFDRPMEEKELERLRPLLKRCSKGEPIEYIIGEVEFYGCAIRVDRRVLIPRPETEILADLVARRLRGNIVWDLCTGSGCLGIALKKKFPELEVTLSDLSAEALALAKENAFLNGVEVGICQGDLLAPFAGRQADCILCNPPYVSAAEYRELDRSVREFEPQMALLGGESGLEFYERLKGQLQGILRPGGQIFFEIGAKQGKAIQKIFPRGELLQDWAGKDRFFFLEEQRLFAV